MELEISAGTVEEAIESALKQLGVRREEVEITVLKKGRSGILGLGADEAIVRVRPLVSLDAGRATEVAKEVLESLLALMKVPATVRIAEPLPQGGAPIAFDIEGEDLGILIGRRGQTLSSLQYIVRLIVAQQLKEWVLLTVDVQGYKRRRYEELRLLALRVAEQVKTTGRSIMLESMPADERRLVHLALADHPDVITQSVGEGEARRVTILKKQ